MENTPNQAEMCRLKLQLFFHYIQCMVGSNGLILVKPRTKYLLPQKAHRISLLKDLSSYGREFSSSEQAPFPWSSHSILSQGPDGLTAFLEIPQRSGLAGICQKHAILQSCKLCCIESGIHLAYCESSPRELSS